MDWDMLLVTGALSGVLMLVVILARIWQDRTPGEAKNESGESSELAAATVKLETVVGQENS